MAGLSGAGGGEALSKAATGLAAVSQAGVTLAVLYYCGQVYTRSWYAYFGIDARVLQFGTADYLLRSVVGYFPLLWVLLGAGALIALRRVPILLATATGNRWAWLRRIARAAAGLGVLLWSGVALASVVSVPMPAPNLVLPLALLGGAGLLGYALYLRVLFPALTPPSSRATGRGTPVAPIVVLLAVAFLAVVWGASSYAADKGTRDAADAHRNGFPHRPAVVLYSAERLILPDAPVVALDVPDSRYRFRYENLYLLTRTTDTYYLVPYTWARTGNNRVYVLTAGDGLRVDLRPR